MVPVTTSTWRPRTSCPPSSAASTRPSGTAAPRSCSGAAAPRAVNSCTPTTSEATTRVFQVEDVTVTVGPGPAAGTLVGLVLVAGAEPQALDGRGVRLIPLDRAALSSSMDDLGNFEFEEVPAGLYALEIDLPDAQVIVEELRLD